MDRPRWPQTFPVDRLLLESSFHPLIHQQGRPYRASTRSADVPASKRPLADCLTLRSLWIFRVLKIHHADFHADVWEESTVVLAEMKAELTIVAP